MTTKNRQGAQRRIGIYAGAFDPVHAGHIAFALQALTSANLDAVYFVAERQPRYKQGVEHFGHRVAMLNRAVLPHPKLKVLELVDINLSLKRTLPHLHKTFPETELVFLFGSDVVPGIIHWPYVDQFLPSHELVIGVRSDQNVQQLHEIINHWLIQPKAVLMFSSYAPHVSSSKIRDALRKRQTIRGLLTSVAQYCNRHWLYVSVE